MTYALFSYICGSGICLGKRSTHSVQSHKSCRSSAELYRVKILNHWVLNHLQKMTSTEDDFEFTEVRKHDFLEIHPLKNQKHYSEQASFGGGFWPPIPAAQSAQQPETNLLS